MALINLPQPTPFMRHKFKRQQIKANRRWERAILAVTRFTKAMAKLSQARTAHIQAEPFKQGGIRTSGNDSGEWRIPEKVITPASERHRNMLDKLADRHPRKGSEFNK